MTHIPQEAIHLKILGRVQGVGFRPFVKQLAQQHNITGWVRNQGSAVEIVAEGSDKELSTFKEQLVTKAPPNARIKELTTAQLSTQHYTEFTVLTSQNTPLTAAHIPPDYSLCDACLLEIKSPTNRRYLHPFINCTQCGPRYTIMHQLPYDREATSMENFEMCQNCLQEYTDPTDRRYHAQALSCPECGPILSFYQNDLINKGNEPALSATITALKAGSILAIKGIGGYHLCCLASSASAVSALRERKRRPSKPFAVMIPVKDNNDIDAIHHYANPTPLEIQQLTSPEKPIVLIRKRNNTHIAEQVAPCLDEIGFMLPYSPLHHLLLAGVAEPLVMTSANISGEPVLLNTSEVEQRLGHIADAFLHHERPILRPAEDSVYRIIANQPQPIRLGRGIAPLEFELNFTLPKPLLAVGGEFKNTIALAWDNRVVISPHIGDLSSPRSIEVFEATIADLSQLYGIEIKEIICDAHPNYISSRWAHQSGLNVYPVFHHHAHASALVAEHSVNEDLLVFTWDGTGYGPDKTFWGGEGLFGQPGNWQRVSSFKSFRLLGGEKAALEPWRTALSVCWEIDQDWSDCPYESNLLKQSWQKQINSPVSTSVGRLFDAASAILQQVYKADFEGHAPMYLEARANNTMGMSIELPLTNASRNLWECDWSPLIALLQDANLSIQEKASAFHTSLANALVKQVEQINKDRDFKAVGLTGGVFQNRLLTEQVQRLLSEAGYTVYLPQHIPGNDAGLSYGQIIEAGYRDSKQK